MIYQNFSKSVKYFRTSLFRIYAFESEIVDELLKLGWNWNEGNVRVIAEWTLFTLFSCASQADKEIFALITLSWLFLGCDDRVAYCARSQFNKWFCLLQILLSNPIKLTIRPMYNGQPSVLPHEVDSLSKNELIFSDEVHYLYCFLIY